MGLENKGTIMYWLCPLAVGWESDDESYHFELPVDGPDGVRVDAHKQPDKTLEVLVKDGRGPIASFKVPVPLLEQSPGQKMGVHIAVTWDKGETKLYLNTNLVETKYIGLPAQSH